LFEIRIARALPRARTVGTHRRRRRRIIIIIIIILGLRYFFPTNAKHLIRIFLLCFARVPNENKQIGKCIASE